MKKLTVTDALILFAVGVGGYTLYERSQKTPADAGGPTGPDPTPAPAKKPTATRTTTLPPASSPYPIERGSRGELVKMVQQKLGVVADGVFGVQTENALLQKTGVSRITNAEGLRRVLAGELVAGPTGPIYTPNPTTVPVAPATPSAASTSAASTSAVPDPKYGTFPLKVGSKGQYVRNLQQHLGVGVDGAFGSGTQAALLKKHGVTSVVSLDQLNAWISGKPATAAAPKPATTTTTTVAPNWKELDPVFRAMWSKVEGNPGVFWPLLVADKATITAILTPKSDAQLKLFIGQYNRAYAALKGVNNSRPTPTLYADLMRLSLVVGGSAMDVLRKRVQRLS